MQEIYLDNAATTRCDADVVHLMTQMYLESYGNPSSAHRKGFDAERCLREASERIAGTLRCRRQEIVFTSGGTEADNLALTGAATAAKRMGSRIIISAFEHPAVEESAKHLAEEGFDVIRVPVDEQGILDLRALEEALTEETILVSVMAVNNEIGSIQPLEEIGTRIKERCPKALFHTDAVQAYGRVALDVRKMKIDLMSVSAHKLHGPKGAGFLYIKEGVRILPQMFGGGQQEGLRSGTENVPGYAGLGLAAKKAYETFEQNTRTMAALRDDFCEQIVKELPDVQINGAKGDASAPHIISLSVKGVRAEVLLHALEEKQIYVSGGSACASNHPSVSRTLQAIGLKKDLLESTIRISLSEDTTKEEMDETRAALCDIVPMLRRYRPR